MTLTYALQVPLTGAQTEGRFGGANMTEAQTEGRFGGANMTEAQTEGLISGGFGSEAVGVNSLVCCWS